VTTSVAGGFRWCDGRIGRHLRADALDPLAEHVFTTRQLQFRAPVFDADAEKLAQSLAVGAGDIVWVKQVHGRAVAVVRPGDRLIGRPEADAVVCTDPSRAIAVRVADCVPVLLADRHRRVVAAIHGGWRGACAGVVPATVAAIADAGVPATDLVAAVGPSIGPCCYQVDDRVRFAFLAMTPDAAAWFAEDGPGHWRLDLWAAATDQLGGCGVPADAIHVARVCTADSLEDCYSYRKEGSGTGRLVAAIHM
jgi:YfiH family protein